MNPVSIVGGGLSGLSLAGTLQREGVPVTLYEARSYPKHKVCGEFICGVSEQILRELGLTKIITDSIHHREMQWYIHDELVLDCALPQVAWGISRYELDQALANRFVDEGGVLVKQKCPLTSSPGVVMGIGKGKTAKKKQWIGLKLHLTDVPVEWKSGLQMHVGDAGYVGLCAVDPQRVNFCGLFRVNPSIKGKGSDLILNYLRANHLQALADQVLECQRDEDSFSAVAGFALGSQATNADFALGDATYLIPPFTGNGMSMAIESTYFARQALLSFSSGESSWEQCCETYHDNFRAYTKKRAWLAEALHPLLFSQLGRHSLTILARSSLLPIQTLFTQLRTP